MPWGSSTREREYRPEYRDMWGRPYTQDQIHQHHIRRYQQDCAEARVVHCVNEHNAIFRAKLANELAQGVRRDSQSSAVGEDEDLPVYPGRGGGFTSQDGRPESSQRQNMPHQTAYQQQSSQQASGRNQKQENLYRPTNEPQPSSQETPYQQSPFQPNNPYNQTPMPGQTISPPHQPFVMAGIKHLHQASAVLQLTHLHQASAALQPTTRVSRSIRSSSRGGDVDDTAVFVIVVDIRTPSLMHLYILRSACYGGTWWFVKTNTKFSYSGA
jgi:hypothetical protein